MTDTQTATSQPVEAEFQARLKDLEEENELLLLQLHQVQEELERYFLKCQELEKGGGAWTGTAPAGGWVDDELPSVQAEVSRLTALVETQTRLRDIESKNALNARLGDILIHSVSPSGSIVGLPAKLLGIWRASTAEQPSAALGGKNFDKVIEAFQKGGLEPVNQLLAAEPAPEMRAKAYTALARHQMKNGLFMDAALSARRAYEEEPKPFRLKWLAFRLHDAGEVAEADACLSLLPQDTPFSDSEARQRDQVRYEAKSVRLRDAKQKTGFESRRQAMESQMQTLRRDSDRHAKLASEREAEIAYLRLVQAKLEEEKSSLAGQLEDSAKQRAERQAQIDALAQTQARLEQEKSALEGRLAAAERRVSELDQATEKSAKLTAEREEENELLLTQLHQVQEELERHFLKGQEFEKARTKLEQEKSELAAQQDRSDKLLAERHAEIDALTAEQARLAGQISDLSGLRKQLELTVDEFKHSRDEQAEIAANRLQEIEALRSEQARLEGEISELSGLRVQLDMSVEKLTSFRDEQSEIATCHLQEIEALKAMLTRLEVEKVELAHRCTELESSVSQLACARDDEVRLAAERLGLLLESSKAQLQSEKEKALLTSRVKELEEQVESISRSRNEILSSTASHLEKAVAQVAQQQGWVAAKFKQQSDDLIRVRNYLDGLFKKEIANSSKQIEAFIGLQGYFASGELPCISTERHTWPVSPDFALYLAELVEVHDYDVIVEFGSGVSTEILAKALSSKNKRKVRKNKTSFISFEHLEKYYRQTLARLEHVGLADCVQLHLAPLVDYTVADGAKFPFYDCEKILAEVAKQIAAHDHRVLAVIDGPPQATGALARYPAGPLLLNLFKNAQVDLLLDDFIREDEKEIARRWQAELSSSNQPFVVVERKFEKDACLISVRPSAKEYQ